MTPLQFRVVPSVNLFAVIYGISALILEPKLQQQLSVFRASLEHTLNRAVNGNARDDEFIHHVNLCRGVLQ